MAIQYIRASGAKKSRENSTAARDSADYILRHGKYRELLEDDAPSRQPKLTFIPDDEKIIPVSESVPRDWQDKEKSDFGSEFRAFAKDADNLERKNGRSLYKMVLAIPKELKGEKERQAFCQDFIQATGLDRQPHLAVLHDNQKNPHMHLIFSERRLDFTCPERPDGSLDKKAFFSRQNPKDTKFGSSSKAEGREWLKEVKDTNLSLIRTVPGLEEWAPPNDGKKEKHLGVTWDNQGPKHWAREFQNNEIRTGRADASVMSIGSDKAQSVHIQKRFNSDELFVKMDSKQINNIEFTVSAKPTERAGERFTFNIEGFTDYMEPPKATGAVIQEATPAGDLSREQNKEVSTLGANPYEGKSEKELEADKSDIRRGLADAESMKREANPKLRQEGERLEKELLEKMAMLDAENARRRNNMDKNDKPQKQEQSQGTPEPKRVQEAAALGAPKQSGHDKALDEIVAMKKMVEKAKQQQDAQAILLNERMEKQVDLERKKQGEEALKRQEGMAREADRLIKQVANSSAYGPDEATQLHQRYKELSASEVEQVFNRFDGQADMYDSSKDKSAAAANFINSVNYVYEGNRGANNVFSKDYTPIEDDEEEPWEAGELFTLGGFITSYAKNQMARGKKKKYDRPRPR